jgi:HD-like signal output (HDOD) protein
MIRATALTPPTGADTTLELLWERVRRQGDMPGFTKTISAILAAMRGEDEHGFSMTQTVLTDPVLTQKVLRLANSSMYSAFGQSINTISKAVLVLGTDAIGHLALGLKLIEEISCASLDSPVAQAEMEKAVLAGMVAQQVAASASARDREEAVVCSILHSLGRMMISFYMPERWAALQERGADIGDAAAALEVLGVSMERVGRATAEYWGLPKNLVGGMRHIEPAERGDRFTHEDWLAALSSMSSQCAESLWHDDAASAETVRALAGGYSAMLGLAPASLMVAIDKAKVAAAADLSLAPLAKPAEKRARAAAATRKRAEGNKLLVSGVSDMRGMAATASPAQMLSVALESVYQGLTFSRAVAFLRNRREHRYGAIMGFGVGVKGLMEQMGFDEAYEPNVFHAALASDRVIFIENAHDPKFAAKLPDWWKRTLSNARSFLILPICANGQPAGFIYGDWDHSFPPIQLQQAEFALLNDLRALMVRTVENRQHNDTAPVPGKVT